MTALSDRLEEIAQEFFHTWHVWRVSQGWTLGPDRANDQMSPYLVGTWDRLTPQGQDWFRQHSAFIIHAVDAQHPSKDVPTHNAKLDEVVDILDSALMSLKQNHTKKTVAKIEGARDLATLLMKGPDGNIA